MSSLNFAQVLVAAAVALTTGCAGGDFSGSGATERVKQQRAETASGSEDAQKLQDGNDGADGLDEGKGGEGIDGEGGGADDSGDEGGPGDQSPQARAASAIAKCLAAWGKHPFGAKPEYRQIYASVSVLGKGGSAVVDDICTEKPDLVLVGATVSVLGATKYELKNPNGWYCIMADVNVITKTTVQLEKRAHLADNKVNVNVMGSGRATSAVGVNVKSDVQVQRVDSGCN